ncbi:MAG TPA: hypothetical protein VHG08_24615 [Longimicrobium sp.]|nr:hypothetical protein [Longimicrobium sp.]
MSESSVTRPGGIATILELDFGGYFMARLATDPDPTNDRRGISGYTMALASEPPLDQSIRLQLDPASGVRVRAPGPELGIRVGVTVREVRFDGARYPAGQALLGGARVSLEGANPPFPGPTFESRNNIVGSDDTMMFIINPFDLAVYPAGEGALPGRGEALLRARDELDPGRPGVRVWEIEDPSTYARRLPTSWIQTSTEALDLLQVYDPVRYFDRRRVWLDAELQRQEDPESLEAQELRSRIYQLELWGARMADAYAYLLSYGFRTNGEQTAHPRVRELGEVDTAHPWHFTCWFGGWDGDLLVGYCKGTLAIPFRPHG